MADLPIENWRDEKQSAWLYLKLAELEKDTPREALFAELAGAAERQAAIWERTISAAKGGLPGFRPSSRARLAICVARWIGVRRARPLLASLKVRGLSVYSGARPGHAMPQSVEEVGRGHKTVAGGNLRAAVFGVNDGLVSNASLILGVAGATSEGGVVLLSGIAGLLAGAFSMAAGEYISVRSQRELFEYQIGRERDELEEYPEEETEELALIYAARGVPQEDARKLAATLMADPTRALDTLAREELGLNPDELGSPLGAAFFSFLSFAIGALIPLAPFLFTAGTTALLVAIALAAVALFAVGAALSLFSGRSSWWGGGRMLLIGAAAGAASYGIGTLFGVATA